ncbi:hypothetical protein CDCA_CDCA10G3063 [Cyanidium caldarium]|uniref:Nucleolar complex-associated protein 3 N-terminal domain-containing protein n=1 Tax=Cyanidium caldarium TaxID=2771 RepID=A0AAV9IY54_CYACA|nr:hypothetical protein CDCA_CDCA10G3063 [Cyanidium caldarium]
MRTSSGVVAAWIGRVLEGDERRRLVDVLRAAPRGKRVRAAAEGSTDDAEGTAAECERCPRNAEHGAEAPPPGKRPRLVRSPPSSATSTAEAVATVPDALSITPPDLSTEWPQVALRISAAFADIAQQPETHIGRVRRFYFLLRALQGDKSPPDAVALRTFRLQMLTLTVRSLGLLFTEACPGYTIRAPDRHDVHVQLSKEVARARAFEATLLTMHEEFLQVLEACLLDGKHVKASRGATGRRYAFLGSWLRGHSGGAAVRQDCLVVALQLLQQLPHMPQADRLARMIVQARVDASAAAKRSHTIGEMLAQAHQGAGASLRVCVQTVRMLCERLRDPARTDVAQYIAPLLRIPFGSLEARSRKMAEAEATVATTAPAPTSRKVRARRQHAQMRQWMQEAAERKRRVQQQLLREWRELDAEARPEEYAAAKREMLAAVTKALLALLLQESRATVAGDSALPLGMIVKGVGRVAPFVNADLLSDMLHEVYAVLQARAPTAPSTTTSALTEQLECMGGAYEVLAAQQAAFQNADPSILDRHLYAVLHPKRLLQAGGDEGAVAAAAMTVLQRALLGTRRALSVARAAAFAMRLLECAATARTAATALAFMQGAAALFDRCPALRRLLPPTTAGRADSKARPSPRGATDDDDGGEDVVGTVGLIRGGVAITTCKDAAAAEDPDTAGALALVGSYPCGAAGDGSSIRCPQMLGRIEARHPDAAVRRAVRVMCSR